MKRFGCILALILMAVPAWPAKKITVAELTNLLKSLQEQKKGDVEVATALKQVQLSEQLTRSKMNDLAGYAAGPQTTEQFYVLEAGSAVLAPPASDIPTTPAPDAAAQKAMLDKVSDYAAKTYSQLPAMTATKTTVRFQDNVEAPGSNSGLVGGAKEVTTGSAFVSPSQYIRYIGSTDSHAESLNGVEKPLAKDKTRWGANGQIALFGQEPNLSAVLREAQGQRRPDICSLGDRQRQIRGGVLVLRAEEKIALRSRLLLLPGRNPGGKGQFQFSSARRYWTEW